jgi:hypothetical protein
MVVRLRPVGFPFAPPAPARPSVLTPRLTSIGERRSAARVPILPTRPKTALLASIVFTMLAELRDSRPGPGPVLPSATRLDRLHNAG